MTNREQALYNELYATGSDAFTRKYVDNMPGSSVGGLLNEWADQGLVRFTRTWVDYLPTEEGYGRTNSRGVPDKKMVQTWKAFKKYVAVTDVPGDMLVDVCVRCQPTPVIGHCCR